MTSYGSFKRLAVIASVVAAAAGWGALVVTHAQTASKATTSTQKPKMRSTTQGQRKAAAAARKTATDTTAAKTSSPTATTDAAAMTALAAPTAAALVIGPDGTLVPDYFGNVPNYATSPQLQKFVDPLPSIPYDPVRLSQLLQNIIGNAVKYRSPDRRPFATGRGAASALGARTPGAHAVGPWTA